MVIEMNLIEASRAGNLNKVKELIANYEVEMEKNITSRWEADLKSDSWLSKNVRPLVLIFLIVYFLYFIAIFI